MADAGGEAGQDWPRRRPEGRWYPGGKGGRPFAARPEHLPDPYNGSHVRFKKEGMYYGKVRGVTVCW